MGPRWSIDKVLASRRRFQARNKIRLKIYLEYVPGAPYMWPNVKYVVNQKLLCMVC
ncbi:unnamed protein product [Larinioides sclopetarius]|uniref:Uncharacterized protein n=1 Tax=Larinioides sclopetarius TaxID=280406 RepID=A0AAV1ZEK1_9ARAC